MQCVQQCGVKVADRGTNYAMFVDYDNIAVASRVDADELAKAGADFLSTLRESEGSSYASFCPTHGDSEVVSRRLRHVRGRRALESGSEQA